MENDRISNDIGNQMQKLQRAEQSYSANYNNIKQVRGDGFDDTAENAEIDATIEQHKTNHMLNALSVIVNEFPALGTVIQGSFGDQIIIPSRPESAVDRPITSSS